MKLLSYRSADRCSWGALVDDQIVDLAAVNPGWSTLARALGEAGTDGIRHAVAASGTAHRVAPGAAELLPVVPDPGKILCVGLNFEKHRIETGRERTQHPVIFTRFPDTFVGHGAPLVRPAESESFDFEGELALVIGRGGRRIAPENALDHIAGVTCLNDGSIRDFQSHTHQFTPGKNFPATGAMGPWMVTLDEIADLSDLELTTRLNGVEVQRAPLSDLTYSIPEIVAYCSSWTELRPGDVIATGTPGGIGARREPPLWMKPGDVCEVEVSGIGVLRNAITADA
ncbi:fumarylacetoacetate hydrolase family protein [Saccharopolyspora sp. TS4A08]|uniref:Fumarylacetoacetate hydrolase family protein n=1 Tax=Saccharopolyspora ipomoeae TaxID=3042027 RepID=A0ABT6PQ86_9PSEU|nr:fumarylacetoacetate hydrolase family protein [Saccharopolyspora sp. TS4A08]MDI2030155.1 fumarylacetoacetate hydrolase family protein [Saccharopolyspora sp. TS4A08]